MTAFRTLAVLAIGNTCLALAGCGGQNREPFTRQTTYAVSGKLLVKGRPAGGAHLTFSPVGGDTWEGPFPTAYSEPDGTFKVQTYGTEDGAPAGKYIVTIHWPTPGEQEERPDQLGGRYASPATSPIRVEILSQENRLKPFETR